MSDVVEVLLIVDGDTEVREGLIFREGVSVVVFIIRGEGSFFRCCLCLRLRSLCHLDLVPVRGVAGRTVFFCAVGE